MTLPDLPQKPMALRKIIPPCAQGGGGLTLMMPIRVLRKSKHKNRKSVSSVFRLKKNPDKKQKIQN